MSESKHPKTQLVVFHDTSCDKKFLILSTYESTEVTTFEGKEYPVCKIDTSSASHPVYTGGKRKTSDEGKVAKFKQRYARLGAAKAKDK